MQLTMTSLYLFIEFNKDPICSRLLVISPFVPWWPLKFLDLPKMMTVTIAEKMWHDLETESPR